MRDDSIELGGFWAELERFVHDRARAMASVVFVLIAVGSIQFHEQMSPALDRLAGGWAHAASKTLRNANLALMSAALPFFVRG